MNDLTALKVASFSGKAGTVSPPLISLILLMDTQCSIRGEMRAIATGAAPGGEPVGRGPLLRERGPWAEVTPAIHLSSTGSLWAGRHLSKLKMLLPFNSGILLP